MQATEFPANACHPAVSIKSETRALCIRLAEKPAGHFGHTRICWANLHVRDSSTLRCENQKSTTVEGSFPFIEREKRRRKLLSGWKKVNQSRKKIPIARGIKEGFICTVHYCDIIQKAVGSLVACPVHGFTEDLTWGEETDGF
jgi:hypothetical protein